MKNHIQGIARWLLVFLFSSSLLASSDNSCDASIHKPYLELISAKYFSPVFNNYNYSGYKVKNDISDKQIEAVLNKTKDPFSSISLDNKPYLRNSVVIVGVVYTKIEDTNITRILGWLYKAGISVTREVIEDMLQEVRPYITEIVSGVEILWDNEILTTENFIKLLGDAERAKVIAKGIVVSLKAKRLIEENYQEPRESEGTSEAQSSIELHHDTREEEPTAGDMVSALMHASENGNVEAVTLLLEQGVEINQVDKCEKTALMYASQRGHSEVVRLLLARGAQVDKREHSGWTALMYASFGKHQEIVKLLIEYKADVNKKDNQSRTALMLAAQEGRLEIVRLLLEQGAQVDVEDDEGWTALMSAVEGDACREVVQLLLEYGAQINKTNRLGRSVISFASTDEIKNLLIIWGKQHI